MRQAFELRRVRDFGQVINDTFTFFKLNLKPLLKALFVICSFFIVLGSVSSIATYTNMSSLYSTGFKSSYDVSRPMAYIVSAAINLLITVLTQAFIHLVTLCYISVYLEKKSSEPTLAEVWGYFRYYFFRVLWASIVIFFILLFGALFCLVPAIYLGPITYLVIPVIVIENSSFGYAFNKSFRLIKGSWWMVFGVLFVMSLIIGIGSSIVNIPITVVTVGSGFLSLKSYTMPLIIVFSILHNIFLLAYALSAIAICMCYFSLSEQKEGTGLLSRIDEIGKEQDEPPTLPSEEY